MRKPEPEFYITACELNGIEPKDAVFLDDIGVWVVPSHAHDIVLNSCVLLQESESGSKARDGDYPYVQMCSCFDSID